MGPDWVLDSVLVVASVEVLDEALVSAKVVVLVSALD